MKREYNSYKKSQLDFDFKHDGGEKEPGDGDSTRGQDLLKKIRIMLDLKDNVGVGEKGILQKRAVGPENIARGGGNRILQNEPWDGDSQFGF
ncbi:hypothetical protein TNCT_82661 [Trichonephila clavata]|uniref:Uncharacterized protein n=1 Tax=Trichonephila clavata TaxID=2740835 RepID=A0A8X6J0S5_TRICU|nr:hypothetical protein TNCT_82661 [Trichonephila clavata]